MRLPEFVIIGAMKCGTSTLHEQLERQPACFMSRPKEPNFFSDEAQYRKGIEWYASLFAGAPAGAVCGESSTHYTKLPTYPRCAARLHEHLPGARLVYMMRDPVDRIVSQYIHEWSERVIDKDCPIDEAISAHPNLLEYSRYAMQLRPYVEMFGFDAILPVFFERLLNDPNTELERIMAHIGCSGPARWTDEEASNVSMQRQRRHPALNTILDVRLLQLLRRTLLPEALRARIRARWTMGERPRLSAESIAWLHERLDSEVHTLGGWLGLENLSCRTFKEQVRRGRAPEWAREARLA